MSDIEAPDWLAGDALEFWRLVTSDLATEKMLRPSHHNALARYCDYLARWLVLRDKVNASGESYVTDSRHGTMQRLNPDFVALLRVEGVLCDLEEKFGLTPAARQRILQLKARQGEMVLVPGQPAPAQQDDETPLGLLN